MNMKKKIAIALLVIVGAVYTFFYFFMWEGSNPISYYSNKRNGTYSTKKEAGYYRQGELSTVLPEGGEISYRGDGEHACKNSKYVYVESTNGIRQLNENGEEVSRKEFSSEDFVECVYAGEAYVYVLTSNQSGGKSKYDLWILNANQIAQSTDMQKVEEKDAVGAFISYDGSFVSHHAVEFADIILYYDGTFEEKDADEGGRYCIVPDEGEQVVPVMAEKTSGRGVLASAEDIIFRAFLAVHKDKSYSWDDGASDYVPYYLKVYCTDSAGETKAIYESEKYKPVLARVSDSILMILGEDFYKKPGTQGSVPYLTGNYRGGVLVYYDMEQEKIMQTYEFEDEQVVYMNQENYATIQDGELRYYEIGKDKPIWTEELQGYEIGKGEVIKYCYEECEGKLVAIQEKGSEEKVIGEYDL